MWINEPQYNCIAIIHDDWQISWTQNKDSFQFPYPEIDDANLEVYIKEPLKNGWP